MPWCRNDLCHDPDRQFERIHVAGDLQGDVYSKVDRFKNPPEGAETWGWAMVFGRVLVSLIESHYRPDDVGCIVAAPANPDRAPDQTQMLLKHAADEARIDWMIRDWPWDDPDDPAIVRQWNVPSMRDTHSLPGRRQTARKLRDALLVRRPERIHGRVLVLDDVFTSGLTLNETARALREAGAAEIDGIILARTVGFM